MTNTGEKKKGFIRRVFSLIGSIAQTIRSVINVLILVVFILFIGSFFGNNVKPLPEKAFLRIVASGMLVEQLSYTDPLTQLMGRASPHPAETLVSDLVEAVVSAKTDPRITGLSLELDYLAGGGINKLSTLGAALQEFKKSGKPIIATGNNYTQEQYFLASFADEIHLNPMGSVVISGYASYRPFFKEALDKLKINFHVFRVGDYKDAVEPYTRNSMSEPSKAQISLWLNALWQSYTSTIEANRTLAVHAIDSYVGNIGENLKLTGGNPAQLALQHGLIDSISSRPETRKRLQALAGPSPDKEHDYLYIELQEYLFHQSLKLPSQDQPDKVALIVAKGTIYDGEQAEGNIGSDTFSELLEQVRNNPNIRALVIRVDSPGGSAFASEVIRHEIDLIQTSGIPVVVSMGSLAASGGYWIAAGADQIWASPTTLTGSIGVFGLVPTFEESLATLGIHSDGIATSPLAGIYRLDRPMNAQTQTLIQLSVDNIYKQFITLVAEGRNSTPEAIHEIAQGRVWTGLKAKELGLVDELGELEDAIGAAAGLAKLDNYELLPIKRPLSLQEQALKQLSESVNASMGIPEHNATLPRLFKQYLSPLLDHIKVKATPNHLYVQCLECKIH